MNDWNALRAHYARITPMILAAPKNEWPNKVDPYEWDNKGMADLTPIEAWLWSDIRCVDAIFYPQYPVGGVFVDFANPKAKVAVECDGAAFHVDKARDAARDARLVDIGWRVYRAPGWLCRKDWNWDGPFFDEETGRRIPLRSEADEFVRNIARDHGLARP